MTISSHNFRKFQMNFLVDFFSSISKEKVCTVCPRSRWLRGHVFYANFREYLRKNFSLNSVRNLVTLSFLEQDHFWTKLKMNRKTCGRLSENNPEYAQINMKCENIKREMTWGWRQKRGWERPDSCPPPAPRRESEDGRNFPHSLPQQRRQQY